MKIEMCINAEEIEFEVKFAKQENGRGVHYSAYAALSNKDGSLWLYHELNSFSEEDQNKLLELLPAIVRGIRNEVTTLKRAKVPITMGISLKEEDIQQ